MIASVAPKTLGYRSGFSGGRRVVLVKTLVAIGTEVVCQSSDAFSGTWHSASRQRVRCFAGAVPRPRVYKG